MSPRRCPATAGIPDVIVDDAAWRRMVPRAEAVVEIGHAMARRGTFVDPDRFAPIYIRKPEAEEKWEAAQATAGGGGV